MKKITTSFITANLDLADLMLREYPGVITGKQVERTRLNNKMIYCFSGLNLEELDDFLKKYKRSCVEVN